MYFADLSAYAYGTYYGPHRIISLNTVRTIGWLESGYPYSEGEVDAKTFKKLVALVVYARNTAINYRGYHDCDFCAERLHNSRPTLVCGRQLISLGSAELWLPSAITKDLFYAAPNLICHYISEHHYRPPQVFLDAVNAFDFLKNWNAEEQCQRLINQERDRIRFAEGRL